MIGFSVGLHEFKKYSLMMRNVRYNACNLELGDDFEVQ